MQEVILAIEKEISLREQELVALHESLTNLRKAASREPLSLAASAEVPHDDKFAGQKIGAAIRQFLQAKHVATVDEIREALTHGGVKWGAYPKRQVKLAIVNSPNTYTIKGDVVTLR